MLLISYPSAWKLWEVQMGNDKLQVNSGKTGFFGPSFWIWYFPIFGTRWGSTIQYMAWSFSRFISQLLLEEQVAAVIRRGFAQLHIVYQLHTLLNYKALLPVTHALVASRVDYCNALCMGIPFKSIWQFQLMWNTAGPIAVCVSCELNWLPLCFWMQFKVLVFTFKVLHGTGPGYLRDHLFPITSTHPIRSIRVVLLVPSAFI